MIKYKLIEEKFEDSEVGGYTAYGIYAVDSGNKKIVETISDIFLDYENAAHFVERINAVQLEPMHLYNVIEDVLINGGSVE